MDHLKGVVMDARSLLDSVLEIIRENYEKYYKYIESYENPREAVLNYLICEDLRKNISDHTFQTDIKLKIDERNRYVDIIVSKDDSEVLYILNRREHGKVDEPPEKDIQKVKNLTAKNRYSMGIVFCFLNPPAKEIRYAAYQDGKKLNPVDPMRFVRL